jgi:uncharacterized protein (DUF2267 family)
MTRTAVSTIERTIRTTNAWLKQIAEEMGEDDRPDAYRALRAVLHALRDRLTVDEAAQFAAQLPLLIRGIFYEGWNPSATPQHYATAGEFLRRVVRDGRLHGTTEASLAVEATMNVIRQHVSAGEIDDVVAVLPRAIRDLIAPPASV